MTSAALVFGVPVDVLDVCAAAKCFPLYQHAVIAMGIIRTRRATDTLRYGQDCRVGLGDLPRELLELVSALVLESLLESRDHGKPHFQARLACDGLVHTPHAMESAEEHENFCERRYDLLCSFESEVKPMEIIKPFLDSYGFELLQGFVPQDLACGFKPAIIALKQHTVHASKDGIVSATVTSTNSVHTIDACCGCYDHHDSSPAIFTLTPAMIRYVRKSHAEQRLRNLMRLYGIGNGSVRERIIVGSPKDFQLLTKAAKKWVKQKQTIKPAFMAVFQLDCQCVTIRGHSTAVVSSKQIAIDANDSWGTDRAAHL